MSRYAYTFRLRHTGSNRVEGPDFDWCCLIDDSDAAGPRQDRYGSGGVYVIQDPDELLNESFNGDTVNLAKGRKVKIHVLQVKDIQASSPVGTSSSFPSLSFETFDGNKTDFGDPCSESDPGQALVVFYNDVEKPDYSVKDFDVELSAYIRPVLSPYSPLNDLLIPSWTKVGGPSSGSFDQTNKKLVNYKNPKEGGLYTFEFKLNGSLTSGANLLLPLGGPDVTAYFMSEVARYNTWYTTLANICFPNGLVPYLDVPLKKRLRSFAECFWDTQRDMAHSSDTYISGNSPCKSYCNHTVTISGHVFGKDQLGNFLFAYCCAKTWLTLGLTEFGSHGFHLLKQGKLDDPEDIAAIAAGYQLGLTPNVDFKTVLRTCGTPISAMQREPEKRGWPSKDVGTGKTYPAYLPQF